MTQMINLPWLSRNLEVIDSTDPTLIGISGVVMDETKRTIVIRTSNNEITMAKYTIATCDSSIYIVWYGTQTHTD